MRKAPSKPKISAQPRTQRVNRKSWLLARVGARSFTRLWRRHAEIKEPQIAVNSVAITLVRSSSLSPQPLRSCCSFWESSPRLTSTRQRKRDDLVRLSWDVG